MTLSLSEFNIVSPCILGSRATNHKDLLSWVSEEKELQTTYPMFITSASHMADTALIWDVKHYPVIHVPHSLHVPDVRYSDSGDTERKTPPNQTLLLL